MKTMNKIFKKSAVLLAFSLLPFLALAGVRSEISIDANGKIVAKNIKVFMISEPGKSKFFYTRALWDDIFIRMTVLTNDATTITKQHGEKATVFDIKEGDIINVEGTLPNSADSLNIQATKIVDLSLLRESKVTSGKVTSISGLPGSFSFLSNKGYALTIKIKPGMTITKGARTIQPSDISVGDKILSARGIFDYSTDILEVDTIDVYQDKGVFTPRNFQGTIKSISGTTLPITLSVTVGSKDYSVSLGEKSAVLNKAKEQTSLTRFVVGDTVRFYGIVRQTDLSAIDADTIRDMDF